MRFIELVAARAKSVQADWQGPARLDWWGRASRLHSQDTSTDSADTRSSPVRISPAGCSRRGPGVVSVWWRCVSCLQGDSECGGES